MSEDKVPEQFEIGDKLEGFTSEEAREIRRNASVGSCMMIDLASQAAKCADGALSVGNSIGRRPAVANILEVAYELEEMSARLAKLALRVAKIAAGEEELRAGDPPRSV